MGAPEQHAFCTVLHDVSPQTWDSYRPLVDRCDALGVPLTLLVIPDHHRHGPLTDFPPFCAAVDRRLVRGDEVALHGYFHQDEQPLRLTPKDWLQRRVFTHEAEFAALPPTTALERLQRGLALFRLLGWPVAGFIPPGWVAPPTLRHSLKTLGLRYTTSFRQLIDLESDTELAAPVIVWSASSRPRRAASELWSQWRLRHFTETPLIRLAIHSEDMHHPQSQQFWLQTVTRLAATRLPLTKRQWLEWRT